MHNYKCIKWCKIGNNFEKFYTVSKKAIACGCVWE